MSIVLAAAASGCGGPPPRAADTAPPVSVATATAGLTLLASSHEAGGVIRARSTADIASRILAPVVAVHVRAGDRVRRGAALVTLDAREMTANRAGAAASVASGVEAVRAAQAEIRSAEAAVVLARTTDQRLRTLYEKRSATAQERDTAVAALEAAEAQLAGARARAAAAAAARDAAQAAADAASVASSYATIAAPFDGIVSQRAVDPGSMAVPGTPLLTLEDPSLFRLEVTLDEARAAHVAAGQRAEVLMDDAEDEEDGVDRWIDGRVAEIARVEPSSHSFVVKIELPPDARWRSGLFARARFGGPARQVLTVPSSALVRRGQLTFVFTIDGDARARLQPISAGQASGDRVEVLAGIHPGDRVILAPPASLSDGAKVTGAGS